jgi:hypothetical protein
MSRFLNNLSENLVNGSNPRYAGSQITPSEQVSWQLKKEEEAIQAIYTESSRRFDDQFKRDFTTPAPSYSSPSYSSSTYPSFNCTNFGRVI